MSYKGKRIVIVGATSAMAEQCARLWTEGSASYLMLVGRSENKLEQIANDLKVRSISLETKTYILDFTDPVAISAMVESVVAEANPDIVLIAHGNLPDQVICQQSLVDCERAIQVNGISPGPFAEAFVKHMEAVDTGVLALIGSVAGDRGRKSNYVYGAAKGLITRYAQGLQHRLALSKSGVKVVLIKPGPTDTPMTASLKNQGAKLASVDAVAHQIIDGIDKGKPTVYAPARWGLIMTVIRHMPSFIFNKIDI